MQLRDDQQLFGTGFTDNGDFGTMGVMPPVDEFKPGDLVHYIDGDNRNQERTNLRFLCPNCHSQTPTFGWKNRRRKSASV